MKKTTRKVAEHTTAQEEHTERKDESKDGDVSLDLSGIARIAKRIDVEKLLVATLLLACMLLVLYVRMLPAALPVTDDWADNTIRTNVRSQLAAQVDAEYPALPQQNRDALVQKRTDEMLATNAAQFQTAKEGLSQQFKTYMRYTGEDGNEYTYLGDLDSYFWLRYTRNLLATGITCDEIRDGQCRDSHILAPYGSVSGFNPSIHVFAIAGLHKIITIFNPQYPLPATSFLVPVLLGVLGVIPAFFIGRRLAGNVGGVFAAILIGVHPLFLSRSMGSDNDIWNIVVPMFVIWFVIETLEAKRLKTRIAYGVLGLVSMTVMIAAWANWWFFYLIILLGLLSYLAFRVVTEVIREKNRTPWDNTSIRTIAGIVTGYYVGTYIVALINGKAAGYFTIPLHAISTGTSLDQAINLNFWPNVLTTVAELNKSSFTEAISSMGGKLFFFGCMLGMLLLVLPRNRWNWKHAGVALLGGLISLYIVNATGLSKLMVVGLFALPIIIVLALYLFEKEEGTDIAAALIALVWFMATAYASYSGVRFILLMIPVFGIGFGVLAGRVHEWVSGYVRKETGWHAYIVNIGVFIVIALVLIQPVKGGYYTARSFVPSIDDAWWDTLTKIRLETAPDTIINSWWDFGHWFKYVADRRVTADGTTQHTHVPRWLGLSLVTPDEHISVGTLRMLTCGSDVYPNEEGPYGAYGRLYEKTGDPLVAQQMVVDLIGISEKGMVENRADARKYLADRGLTPSEQDAILNVTHCDPPEDIFITSGDMIGKAGVWAHFGLWNFTKSYIAANAKTMNRDDAVADFTVRFGMSAEEAEKLYFDARALASEGDTNAFAAPWPGYITGAWVGCQARDNDTRVVCPLGLNIGTQNGAMTVIEDFTFNVSAPNASTLTFGVYANGQRIGGVANGTPARLVLALDDRLDDIVAVNPTTGIGVLYDAKERRVLLADPLLIKSTFTQLFYLDGRYTNHFVKFDDRTSFNGQRVISWKVDWDGITPATTSTVGSGAYVSKANAE